MGIHAVILAGGRGERFWPLSRRDRPKQFLRLLGSRSLLQETAGRLEGWIGPGSLWVVAGAALMPEIQSQLGAHLRPDRCIVEPVARNTAPAIGAAAAALEAVDPGSTMLVLPSDHWIPDADAFRHDVERAASAAEALDGLHLFGIPITRPETGYGYVEGREELAGHPGVAPVTRFHEKPDRAKALIYARRPEMLWNSGIFLWRARTILEALIQHLPSTREALERLRGALAREGGRYGPESTGALQHYMEVCPVGSIDHAVLERHDHAFVTRATFRWSDLGGWLAWGDQLEPDERGNRGRGASLLHDVRDSIFYSEEGLVALLGVRDLVVVHLRDVTLVCPRERAQEIRELVREVRERGDHDLYL